MKTVEGKFNTAKVMTDNVDDKCLEQIKAICSEHVFSDAKIRVMPDCHSGKGCVIGFTALIEGKAVPNLVGVDISCSISTYKLDTKIVDFQKLDDVIRKYIPSGQAVRSLVSPLVDSQLRQDIEKVCQEIDCPSDRILKSIGTLGGGNHFIELNKDKDGNLWLSVHTGSRNLGLKICKYHQTQAEKYLKEVVSENYKRELKLQPPAERSAWHESHKMDIPDTQFAYIENDLLDKYVEHMKVAERFATKNHEVIVHEICSHMGWNIIDSIFTHHNYIEFLENGRMIIRKGAISAKKGERVIIPLNMRDGSIIGVGKGNDDWNNSAPHGAGRLYSRSSAKETFTVEEFKEQMSGIWTSCVGESTLDESPMAYKDIKSILSNVIETIDITDVIRPIYNFKAN